MNNPIVITKGKELSIDKQIESAYISLIKEKEMIEESLAKVEEQLKTAMRDKGILSIKTDRLSITYVQPTIRESFDRKKFQAEMPDLYDEYISFTNVRDSVRIKVKNEEHTN